MSKNATNTKTDAQVKGYSTDYTSIRKEVQSKWPSWKVSTYNANFATSAHANKLSNNDK